MAFRRLTRFSADYQFTSVGGCGFEQQPTDEILWAFDAFNANAFLRVNVPQSPVVLTPGQTTSFTVYDGQAGSPFAGASFNGQTSGSDGVVSFTAPTVPGVYRYKAMANSTIRSNAVVVEVQG